MLRQNVIFVLLVCFCANSLASDVADYKRVWLIEPSKTTFLHQGTIFATDAITYPMAECNITDPKTERLCDVTLVTKGRKDHTCKGIRVFAEEGKILFFNGFFQITPFGRDYVAVGWYNQPDGPITEPKLVRLEIFYFDTLSRYER